MWFSPTRQIDVQTHFTLNPQGHYILSMHLSLLLFEFSVLNGVMLAPLVPLLFVLIGNRHHEQ